MLTSAELTAMQTTQSQAMMDVCKLMTPTATTGDFGQEGEAFADGSEIACGFESPTAQRGGNLAGVSVELNAQLRLSLTDGISVTPNHHIKLTKRLGMTLAATEEYRVVGWPRRGPTCFVVELERVR